MLRADGALEQPRPARIAEHEDLALDGAHGHARLLGQPLEPGGPGTGREQHALRGDLLAAGERHAGHALAVAAHGGDAGAAAQRPARALDRRGERGHEPPRVHRLVAVDRQREPDGRRERRLEPAGLARAQPLDVEPERAPEGEQALERLGLVAVAGDDERARRAPPRIEPRRRRELLAEGREGRGAAQPELEQRALARLGLGDRGEHARGDLPGAALAGVEHERAQPALRGPPGGGQADDAAADDHHVPLHRSPAHAPPYAGITRIRFDGRRPGAALSARMRAPVRVTSSS